MKTIETMQIAGSDKLLHRTIPVDEPTRKYRMVIVLVAESEEQGKSPCDERSWPEGYVDRTYGSIQDESFFRYPQCDRCLDKPQST